MIRLTPIEATPLQAELQQVLASSQIKLENAPNFLKILANSPVVIKAHLASAEALAHGRLTPRERQQIALAVAEINASNYCLVAHSLAARDAGLSAEEIQLARHATARVPREQAMLTFAQAIALQRGKISDDDFGALLKAGFSHAELLEIIANIAHNIFTNYLNLAAKTEIDNLPLPSRPECPPASTQLEPLALTSK